MIERDFDEQLVRDAYALVRRCIEAYQEYQDLGWKLRLKYADQDGPEQVRPHGQVLNVLQGCVEEMSTASAKAEPLVDALVWHAPALAPEPVRFGFVSGSSWAEATVILSRTLVERSQDWTSFEQQDEQTQGYMLRVLLNLPIKAQDLAASVKIEAARIRDRARALGAHSRYGIVLTKLTRQSAQLLKLLLDNEGRVVPYSTIFETLWLEDYREKISLQGRMTTALYDLREELSALDLKRLKARIKTHPGTGIQLREG